MKTPLTETEEKVYQAYLEEPHLTIQQIAENFDRSKGTIKLHLTNCFQKGFSKRGKEKENGK